MFSDEYSDDSVIIAAVINDILKKPRKPKYVYYSPNKTNENKHYKPEDLKQLLSLQYGKTATRWKNSINKLELPENSDVITTYDLKKEDAQLVPFYPFNNNNHERNVYNIIGPSGSGKSTIAKMLTHLYSQVMKCYIVSPVKDDEYSAEFVDIDQLVEINDDSSYEQQNKKYEEALIKFKYLKKSKNIDINTMLELEIELNKLKPKKTKESTYKLTDYYLKLIKKPTFWVFDDIEADDRKEKIKFLMDSQLLTGRHDNISMAILLHLANNGQATRNIINESHIYIIFQFNKYIEYFLKTYIMLNKNEIQNVRDQLKKSKYVSVYRRDNLMLNEKQIFKY